MVFLLSAVLLAADQITKYLAIRFLPLHQPRPFIGDVCSLTLVHNKGAAFGILKDQQWAFIAASAVASVIILGYLRKEKARAASLPTVAAGMILAGALGNMVDRVRLGYVIDFIDFHFWPVFNVADSAITIGALGLAWHLLTEKKERRS